MKLTLSIPQTPALIHALPVMDLLVLVLVIPLLSYSLAPEEGMAVELPETSFRMQRIDDPVVVTVSMSASGPEVWVERRRLGDQSIEEALMEQQEKWEGEGTAPILLRVDQNVSSGFQLEYVDRIKTAGFQKVYLATQNPR